MVLDPLSGVIPLLGGRMWLLSVLAVIVLLFLFPRKIIPILSTAALAALIVGAYYYWDQRETQRRLDRVVVSVRYDTSSCSQDKPLLLTIENASDDTVERVRWMFSARRPGYRGELGGAWLREYATESPLAAGESYTACYTAPKPGAHAVSRETDLPENLELGVRNKQVEFAR